MGGRGAGRNSSDMQHEQDSQLVLTFDCGTQSVRAFIFDQRGKLYGKAKVEYEPYYSVEPGWADQDPQVYWSAICQASRELKDTLGDDFSRIVAVTMTAMRDTFVALDRDLRPLRPVIVWLDQRLAECRDQFPLWTEAAYRAVGMYDAAVRNARITKSNWIRENEPEIWQKTHKYVTLSCYLNYLLTGELSDSVASQIGHIPFDYKKKTWMSRLNIKWYVFGLPRELMPTLCEPGAVIGKIGERAAAETGITVGVPLIATGADKSCETLGSGAIAPDMAALSFGTASTVQLTTRAYVEPVRFLPAYPAVFPGHYNPEIQIYRGYWMVSWFKREFAEREILESQQKGRSAESILDESLRRVPPGSDGLILQPYWGPGLDAPEARGAIIGFSERHTRVHIYRAIIEGINFGLIDALSSLERRAGVKVGRLTVSGGGAQRDEICQITADMFGLPVYRAQTFETSGLGSSIAAFVGLGVYRDYSEAIAAMVHYDPVFRPNPEHHAIYARLYHKIYRNIYRRLRPLYQEMTDIDRTETAPEGGAKPPAGDEAPQGRP